MHERLQRRRVSKVEEKGKEEEMNGGKTKLKRERVHER
jgi:hypothetical protein